ncbi:MAG: hypothetical protein ACM3JB_09495, partial [Acidobacteriaceae bacterium]
MPTARAVEHGDGAKAGKLSKTAVAHAEPRAPVQGETSQEKDPQKLTGRSAREALTPLVTTLHHRAATARKHSAARVPVASAQAAGIRSSTERSRAAAIQTVTNLDAAKTGQVNRSEF